MYGLNYSTLAALLILFVPGCYMMALDAIAQPERCTLPKPAKTMECSENKTSRFFFHETKGCKRSGFCDPEDISIYDEKNDQNYFLTKESCAEICQMHVRCPTVEPVVDGTVSNGGIGYWGSSVTYSCNKGFILSGIAVRTCESSGKWDSEAPSCIAKCPKPNTEGQFTFSPLQDFYTPGDTIVYACEHGFGQVGENYGRTCLEDGTWSGKEVSCEVELQCPKDALRPIVHGSVAALNSTSVGSTVSFFCDAGYNMYGIDTIKCNESGSWSGDRPTCWKIIIEMCEESNPDHGGSDVTNATVPIEQGERNTWFVPSISNPNPFVNQSFTWDEQLAELPGVTIHGDRLKITTVLATGVQERKYHVFFFGFEAYFGLTVTETTHTKLVPILQPQSVEKSLGDELSMVCVFQGCPTPNVMWFHNDERLQTNSRTIVMQNEVSTFTTSTLIITEITSDDLGRYRCLGENGDNRTVNSTTANVVLASSTKLAKRSTEDVPLCRSKTPSDTVTIIGRVRRESVKLNTATTTVYRMNVERVLSPNSGSLPKRTVRTVVLDHNVEAEHKLNNNGLYILQGKLHDNTFFVQSHDSVLNHSLELEHSIQQC